MSTQLKGILTTVKILAVLAITSIAASTWWAATITGEVRHLSAVKGSTVVNLPLDKKQQ